MPLEVKTEYCMKNKEETNKEGENNLLNLFNHLYLIDKRINPYLYQKEQILCVSAVSAQEIISYK